MTGALGNKDKYMLFVKSTIVLSDCNYQSDCCCLVSSHFCALIYVKCVRIKNKQVITRWWTPSLWLTSAASAAQKQQINFLFQSLGTIGNFKETVNLSVGHIWGKLFPGGVYNFPTIHHSWIPFLPVVLYSINSSYLQKKET